MNHLKKSDESHALFRSTWRLLYVNQRKFDYWIEQDKFSIQEKRLLNAFKQHKKNKKEEALELLKAKIPNDSFLEGVRLYLIGLIYNQHGHYFYAIENLKLGMNIFRSLQDTPFLLNSLFLIAVAYGNRRELPLLAQTLDEIRDYKLETKAQEVQFIYAEMIYHVLMNNKQAVEATFEKAERLNVPEYDPYRPYFLVQKFMFHAYQEEFVACDKVLDVYKTLAGNLVKVNYSYMRTLLDHIHKGSALYIYPQDYKGFPELQQQLEVIKYLSEGQFDLAEKTWQKLAHHNPQLYGPHFHFKGEFNLFSQCLRLYRPQVTEFNFDQIDFQKLSSPIDKLIFLLIKVPKPFPAADLIKLIWNEEISEKNLARLRTIVSRYNRKETRKIVSIRGSYQFEMQKKHTA